jgi:Ca2+-dependent lipid-binding protein
MDSEQAAKQAAMENVTKQSEELTPEQKKALAKEKASVVLESLPTKDEAPTLTNDQGTNDAATLAAAISAADNKPTKEIPRQNTPGSFAKKENPFGWNAYSSLPNPGEEDKVTELNDKLGLDSLINMYKGQRSTDEQKDLLGQFLNEAYYGEWYHNSAVMLFTVVFTWLLTRFGGGLMACLVVGAFLATYYQTSIRRLRRNIRDDIQRELAINRLETEEETAGWINHFMSRFWLIYEPVLSAQIVGIADSILIENTPSFLDSIRLSEFTLGTKAPFIEGIKTLTRTEPNIVVCLYRESGMCDYICMIKP